MCAAPAAPQLQYRISMVALASHHAANTLPLRIPARASYTGVEEDEDPPILPQSRWRKESEWLPDELPRPGACRGGDEKGWGQGGRKPRLFGLRAGTNLAAQFVRIERQACDSRTRRMSSSSLK